MLCDELLVRAERLEGVITGVLQEMASGQGGRMEGLQYRLKSRESLLRKCRADVEEAQVSFMLSFRQLKDADRAPEPKDELRKIGDVLRSRRPIESPPLLPLYLLLYAFFR